MKQGDGFLEYAIWKVPENQRRLEMNGTHQLLLYADDVNAMDENINKIETRKLVASKEFGLQVNGEKTVCVSCCHQNAGQNDYLMMASFSKNSLAKLKYFGTTVIKQSYIHGESNSGLNLGILSTSQFRIFCLPVSCLGI
jgi:hypothetical protein